MLIRELLGWRFGGLNAFRNFLSILISSYLRNLETSIVAFNVDVRDKLVAASSPPSETKELILRVIEVSFNMCIYLITGKLNVKLTLCARLVLYYI